jgi:hypothetical protein
MKFNFETLVRLMVAGILLQTLFFKFTAAEESVYIFTTLGIEPVGRIGSGVAELIAAVLVLLPSTIGIGAALALGVIAGALMSHLTILGIEIKGDGGTLFYLALVVFIGSACLAWKHRKEIPVVKNFFSYPISNNE